MASIWKGENKVDDDKLFLDIEEFFNHIQDSKVLQYRDGQRSMAYSIVDTIKDKSILLIEAGVGIGKSYAYLIPLMKSIQNDEKFQGFIIATSTIALQEQLVTDVKNVADMLGISDIEIVLAKGKNNYICRKRLNEFLMNSDNEQYAYILNEVIGQHKLDRKDYQEITDKVWRNFNIRSCIGKACQYYADCTINLERENYDKAKIIITNQDLLAQDLKKEESDKLFKGDRFIVIDEAHNLEEKVRNSYVLALDKREIESLVGRLYYSVSGYQEEFEPHEEFYKILASFFTRLRANSRSELKKADVEVENFFDFNRAKFKMNSSLRSIFNDLIKAIDICIKEVNMKNDVKKYNLDQKCMEKVLDVKNILRDMLLEDKSENIYWVDFLDRKGDFIRLVYSPKKIDELSAKLFSKVRAGVVLTSATLSINNDNYNYYSSSMGLDKVVGKPLLKEFPEESPYNYDKNTILYAPKDIPSPKGDKNKYLDSIVSKIEELIEISNGKTLILFTSKNDMNYVNNNIDRSKFDFPIYVQGESGGINTLKEQFQSDVSSCLLATGSFYEGIDIKGESLSQVIITKLPFSVVDPVMDYKASEYVDGFLKVYLPDMITKLKQGTGRAIRSETDTAIISILDSRVHDYNIMYDNMIFNSLPFSNVTDDIDEVKQFAKNKIKG